MHQVIIFQTLLLPFRLAAVLFRFFSSFLDQSSSNNSSEKAEMEIQVKEYQWKEIIRRIGSFNNYLDFKKCLNWNLLATQLLVSKYLWQDLNSGTWEYASRLTGLKDTL